MFDFFQVRVVCAVRGEDMVRSGSEDGVCGDRVSRGHFSAVDFIGRVGGTKGKGYECQVG